MQGQALRVSWKNLPRPVGLAVFFPKALHCPACGCHGGKNSTQAAVPDKDYDYGKIEYDNIPEWAIYALEYGISEDMSLDDVHQTLVSKFIKSNFPNGYIMEVLWNKYTGFDRYPAFGKPCGTYSVNFWIDNQLK